MCEVFLTVCRECVCGVCGVYVCGVCVFGVCVWFYGSSYLKTSSCGHSDENFGDLQLFLQTETVHVND